MLINEEQQAEMTTKWKACPKKISFHEENIYYFVNKYEIYTKFKTDIINYSYKCISYK